MCLRDKRIFIVEDNSMNRVVFQIALRAHGAQIEFDARGRDMIRSLEGFNPELIILDLMITHGLSGFAIFEEIRGVSDYDSVPIVAVSAAEPAIAIPKAQAMGFDGFIAKPIDDELFPEQLVRILNGEKIWYAGERLGN